MFRHICMQDAFFMLKKLMVFGKFILLGPIILRHSVASFTVRDYNNLDFDAY